jgi:tetratricopeptide (TPR) repeat protein
VKSKPVFLTDEETLHEYAQNPQALERYIEILKNEIKMAVEPIDKVRRLGETGVYLRSAGRLEEAEIYLLQALAIIETYELGLKIETQQKIRLAHVYQWQKNFTGSDELFEEVINTCRKHAEANSYLPFALQHAGKNYFDQHQYKKALAYFEEALKLRTERASSADQILSTETALRVTRNRLK